MRAGGHGAAEEDGARAGPAVHGAAVDHSRLRRRGRAPARPALRGDALGQAQGHRAHATTGHLQEGGRWSRRRQDRRRQTLQGQGRRAQEDSSETSSCACWQTSRQEACIMRCTQSYTCIHVFHSYCIWA